MQPTPLLFSTTEKKGMISVCIVTRNASSALKRYLDSLLASVGDKTEVEIIVVDNESTDDTRELLEKNYPGVKHIYRHPGVGFTKGINTAIAASSGEFILIATPSTEIIGNAIPQLLDFLKKFPAVGTVGPKVLHPDGSTQYSSKKMPTPKVALLHTLYLFGLIRSSTILDEYFLFNYEAEEPLEVTSLTMSLLLARRAVFEDVGLLDESLFVWASDVDWCYEVEKSAWKQFFLPAARVFHRRNSVSKKQPYSNLLYYHQDLDTFYKKHFAHQNGPLINSLWWVMLQVRLVAQTLRYIFFKNDDYSFY
jgi:N-acetylglucosaminyl-diphospho-decaprenol L-rhamnosyltransferase